MEEESIESKRFWSTIVSAGDSATIEVPDDSFFIISNVCVNKYSISDLKHPVRLFATVPERSLDEVIVAILVPGQHEFQQLDFRLYPNEKVTLSVSTDISVHVSGYILPLEIYSNSISDLSDDETATIKATCSSGSTPKTG